MRIIKISPTCAICYSTGSNPSGITLPSFGLASLQSRMKILFLIGSVSACASVIAQVLQRTTTVSTTALIWSRFGRHLVMTMPLKLKSNCIICFSTVHRTPNIGKTIMLEMWQTPRASTSFILFTNDETYSKYARLSSIQSLSHCLSICFVVCLFVCSPLLRLDDMILLCAPMWPCTPSIALERIDTSHIDLSKMSFVYCSSLLLLYSFLIVLLPPSILLASVCFSNFYFFFNEEHAKCHRKMKRKVTALNKQENHVKNRIIEWITLPILILSFVHLLGSKGGIREALPEKLQKENKNEFESEHIQHRSMIKEKKKKRTKQQHLMHRTRRTMTLNLQNTSENHQMNESKTTTKWRGGRWLNSYRMGGVSILSTSGNLVTHF